MSSRAAMGEAGVIQDLEGGAPRIRLSARVAVGVGDCVRVTGGPTYRGKALGPRGTFRIVDAIRSVYGRTYVDAVRLDKHGLPSGLYTLYVGGRPYRRSALPHVVFRPHRLRNVRLSCPNE